MDPISFIVPAAYTAALAWTLCGDFLRAQLGKDLERQRPAVWRAALQAASLPTFCLTGALLLRVLVDVRGLLLTALAVASAISIWNVYRTALLRSTVSATPRRPFN